jgi:hypothetical protein
MHFQCGLELTVCHRPEHFAAFGAAPLGFWLISTWLPGGARRALRYQPIELNQDASSMFQGTADLLRIVLIFFISYGPKQIFFLLFARHNGLS